MKKNYLLFFLLLCLSQTAWTQTYDLYLCIGQSNMAGRGTLTPETADTIPGVYLFNDRNEFEPAANPLNRYSTIRKDIRMQGVGPAYGFAKTMAAKTGRKLGLVVNARGGSSIRSWKKGAKDGYYEQALARVREAMKRGGILKAILWHQGETDCEHAGEYKKWLRELVANLRKDLDRSDLLFVAGEIADWAPDTSSLEHVRSFNAMIRRIGDFIPNSACVSSEGLKPLIDESDPHFCAESQLLLGERYAQKVLEWQGGVRTVLVGHSDGKGREKGPVRIACVGNSITYGAGIRNNFQNSYPGILSQWLGEGYDVRNFGISARTLLNKGDYPYMHEPKFRELRTFEPDIVTIKLGTNDSKPWNWRHGKEFTKDLTEMLDILAQLPSRPKIYLCLPIPVTDNRYGIRDSIVANEIVPAIRRVAKKRHLPLIDLYAAMKPYPDYCSDGVHPNEAGAAVIAGEVYRALTGKEAPAYTPQAFPGRKTDWNGFDRYDFIFNGRNATVVAPRKAVEGRPWIWRPAFFGAFPSVDKALLERGFHVAYYDLTHLYGSPRAVRLGTEFYQTMCRYYHLSSKVTLEGFSRGGLCALNWAAQHPDKVACIYLDAPVCDVFSWPGRGQKELWEGLLKEWNLTDGEMNGFKGNPIDHLEPLARWNIPLISVCGDSDKTVPFEENMKILAERYRALGGNVELILRPGCDHHPHSLTEPEPVVDFIVRNQPDYQKKQSIHRRGGLANSYLKFEKEKKGCVAFLGGSITEMRGWRDMLKEDLKQRFPETEFQFIEVGLPSAGTTPHAFRYENDVLQKGTPDLLFVEGAVNDHGNGFGYVEQTRGMEGIVRHALRQNPELDIVMLHFIYEPFIPMQDQGICPDVVMNHERVANHYRIPSIDLTEEIARRVRDGEFDWKHFGGTHPAWEGHKYYAAAINRLFDLEWSGDSLHRATVQPHPLPEKPLDAWSYADGAFIDIRKAKVQGGWKVVDDWTPTVKAGTREGFVHVPMLVVEKAGASLALDFEGSAIGLFCAAGPQACVLEYSVDGAPFKKLDTYTAWSHYLYLPWTFMLETELTPGKHQLRLRVAKGERTGCQIRNFVVNTQNTETRRHREN